MEWINFETFSAADAAISTAAVQTVTLTDGFCDFVSSLRHKERMTAHLSKPHHYGQHFTVVM